MTKSLVSWGFDLDAITKSKCVFIQGRQQPVMYESYVIASCQNFQIMQVTTVNTLDPKPVLSSEKAALYLPVEMSAFTVDHTSYYYTGKVDIPGTKLK